MVDKQLSRIDKNCIYEASVSKVEASLGSMAMASGFVISVTGTGLIESHQTLGITMIAGGIVSMIGSLARQEYVVHRLSQKDNI